MTCVTQTWWQRRMWIQSSVWISDIMLRQNKMRIGCYVIVVEIFTKLQILLQKEIIFKSGFLPAKAFHDCHSNKSGGGIYAARLEQQGKMSFKKWTARRSGGAASITDVIHTDLLKGRKTTKLRTRSSCRWWFRTLGVDLVLKSESDAVLKTCRVLNEKMIFRKKDIF